MFSFRMIYYITQSLKNISYLFRRHKKLIIVLVAFCLFLLFKSNVFAADWSTTDQINLSNCNNYLSSIRWTLIPDLQTKASTMVSDLNSIKSYLQSLDSDSDEVQRLLGVCNTYLNIISNYQLGIRTDVNEIKKILAGTGTNFPVNYQYVDGITANSNNLTFINLNARCFYFPIQQGVTYSFTIDISGISPSAGTNTFKYGLCSNVPALGGSVQSILSNIYLSSNQTSYSDSYSFTASSNGYFFIAFHFNVSTVNYDLSVYSDFNPALEGGLIGVITDGTQQQTEAITSSIDTATDFLKDDDVSDDSMDISSTGLVATDDLSLDNFFTNFLGTIQTTFTNIDNSVETIDIGFPHTNNKVTLRSDLLSSHIQGTVIYTMIQAFWWFVIGSYLVMFGKRIFDWLVTGELAAKGPSAFIKYLDKNNELIRTYMM